MLSYNLLITSDTFFFYFSCQRAAPAPSDMFSLELKNTRKKWGGNIWKSWWLKWVGNWKKHSHTDYLQFEKRNVKTYLSDSVFVCTGVWMALTGSWLCAWGGFHTMSQMSAEGRIVVLVECARVWQPENDINSFRDTEFSEKNIYLNVSKCWKLNK